MKRWQWQAQQLTAGLGLPGIAGLALLVLGIIIQLGAIQPSQRDIASIEAQLAGLRSRPQLARQYAPAEELALFFDFFPTRDQLPRQLRMVHQQAANAGLSVERVDYKLSRVAGTPLWRYQVTFPLVTDYSTLRHYLADVLEALPNASLENIELTRPEASTDELDAKISLALYFREAM